jgi:hypothetical protein
MLAATLLEVENVGRIFLPRKGDRLFGPGRTGDDPLAEILYDLGRESLLRRHLEVFILVAHRLDEQARLDIPRDDGGSRVSAGEKVLEVIDLKRALHLVRRGAVARVAFLREDGPNLFFEEGERRRGVRELAANRAGGNEEKCEKSEAADHGGRGIAS